MVMVSPLGNGFTLSIIIGMLSDTEVPSLSIVEVMEQVALNFLQL